MGMFGKRKRQQADSGIGSQWRVKLGVWVRARERELADYLNRKTVNLSSKCWLLLLISFCAGVGGYLLHLIRGIFN